MIDADIAFLAYHGKAVRVAPDPVRGFSGGNLLLGGPQNGGSVTWPLLGSIRKREVERFELLAELAALELGCPAGNGAVSYWLDCLKAESLHLAAGQLVSHYDGYGGAVTTQYELIDELFMASAEFCLKLEQREKSGSKKARAPVRHRGRLAERGSVNTGAAGEHPSDTVRDGSPNSGS